MFLAQAVSGYSSGVATGIGEMASYESGESIPRQWSVVARRYALAELDYFAWREVGWFTRIACVLCADQRSISPQKRTSVRPFEIAG